jgi:eukaryotic-like serine/threonine-protein kinase
MNGLDGFLLEGADAVQRGDQDTLVSEPPGRDAAAGPRARNQPAGQPESAERIGSYELIRELGRGGMGAVFLARDTKLGRRVAIKFLHAHNPELTARFILEARATARCHHENIIVIHDVAEHRGNPYMVLEYLEGSPLSKLLGKDHGLPPGRAVELVVPVVRALVRAHSHNIVHRDLKPDNIFVTDSGTVKVLDFGIAKLMQGGAGDAATPGLMAERAALSRAGASAASMAELTRRGALVGTIPYMSPEQLGRGRGRSPHRHLGRGDHFIPHARGPASAVAGRGPRAHDHGPGRRAHAAAAQQVSVRAR